jgi:hypothetical protein
MNVINIVTFNMHKRNYAVQGKFLAVNQCFGWMLA